ncbi:MAG: PAS domain-containing protein, partial [Acidimicrobiia bacterium]
MPGSATTPKMGTAARAAGRDLRRLAEDVPRAAAGDFDEAFASFPDLAWLIEVRDGPRYVYVKVNPALLRWAGVDDPDRVLDKTPDELLPPEAATPYMEVLDELTTTGGDREVTLRYKAAGRTVVFESYLRLLPPNPDGRRYVLGAARDVSDTRRHAEETAAAIRQVAEHYEAVRIGVALIDPAGVISWANAALVDLVRGDDLSLVDRRLSDLLHPEDAGDIDADLVLGQSEQRLRCADGSFVWVRMTSTLVTSVVGGELYTLVQVEDVTARRLAEEALREQRDRFMSLASSSPIGIFFTDPAGNLLFSNERLREITGLTDEGLAGRGWLSVVHPDDAAMVHALVGALASESELSLPYRLVLPDGQIRWVHARLAKLLEDGETTGFAGTVEDITIRVWSEQALTEREAEYRLLANMSSDLISRHDADGVFLYASPASRALLGYEPHELVGMRLTDLVHPDDVHQVQLDNRHLATRENVTITCRVRHSDGHWVW